MRFLCYYIFTAQPLLNGHYPFPPGWLFNRDCAVNMFFSQARGLNGHYPFPLGWMFNRDCAVDVFSQARGQHYGEYRRHYLPVRSRISLVNNKRFITRLKMFKISPVRGLGRNRKLFLSEQWNNMWMIPKFCQLQLHYFAVCSNFERRWQ